MPFRAPAVSLLDSTPAPRPRRVVRWVKAVALCAAFAVLVAVAPRLGIGPTLPWAAQAGTPSASTNVPPLGHEEAAHRLLPAPPPVIGPAATHYRFVDTERDGTTAVTWSPCRPIHFVVRSTNAPADGAQMLAEAFARLSAATGLQFVNDGPTTEAPSTHRSPYQPDKYGRRWAPVLIVWATAQEVPDFGTDVAGEAGPSIAVARNGSYVYVSGRVYLDPTKISRIASSLGEGVGRAVILHELGHLVGLDHVTDPSQIMFPRGNALHLTEYQTGDLAGLAALGQGACHPDV